MNKPIKPDNVWLNILKERFYVDENGDLRNYYTKQLYKGTWNDGYMRICLSCKGKQKGLKIHHIVWFIYYNEWPDEQIDHKDLNTENNNINNLRKATYSIQQLNKFIDNGLPPGVSYNKRENKYEAQIKNQGIKYFLGYYECPVKAGEMYKKKYREIYNMELII